MLTWSTDTVPQPERFAFWREVRAKNLFGVTAELEREKHGEFRGVFSVLPLGGATLVEIHASAYRVRRSAADIARAPSDSLCVYQQIDGACWFDSGKGDEFVLPAGALAVSYSDLPYATTPTSERGFHLRLIKIPFARCLPFAARAHDLPAQALQPVPGAAALLAAYFRALVAEAGHLDHAAAETATDVLAQLALLARGQAAPEDEMGAEAIRAGRLLAARQFIEHNLHRPELSPAAAAAALGVSPRLLHLLFEPTGTSFARYLLQRRLERARLLLGRHPQRSVYDVALACGIESTSVFYRGFRARFGMTPSDYRASLR